MLLLKEVDHWRSNTVYYAKYYYIIDAQRRVGQKALLPYVNSEGADKRANLCRLIWARLFKASLA